MMTTSRLLAALVCIGAAAHANRADAQDFTISIPQTNVEVPLGGHADVPVTIRNNKNTTSPPIVLYLTNWPAPTFTYEQLSTPECGEFVTSKIHVSSTLTPLPPTSERTCMVRVSRDATVLDNLATFFGLEIPGQGLHSRGVYFGTFDDIGLTSEVVTREVDGSQFGRNVFRLTAQNNGPISVQPLVSLNENCSRPDVDIVGGCEIIPARCDIVGGTAAVAKIPVVAPAQSVSCLVGYSGQWNGSVLTRIVETSIDHVIDAQTGGLAMDPDPSNDHVMLEVGPPAAELNQYGISGSWANHDTPSQGFVINVQPDFYGSGEALLFGGWFTYGASIGVGQRWYTIQGQVHGLQSTMDIYLTDGGALDSSHPTTTTSVGSVTLRFANCSQGYLDYMLLDGTYRTGSIPLTRILPSVTCEPDGNTHSTDANYFLSGTWADPSNSGQGLVADVDPSQHAFFAAWYTFDAGALNQQRWYTLQATLAPGASSSDAIAIYTSTGGVFNSSAATTTTQVGNATIAMNGCNEATLTYAFTSGENAGRSGTLDLERIGYPPPGCTP
jgi:hypothetical protein